SASITGYEGDDTLAYQWTSGTTVLGSGSTHQVSETDEGNKITLTVTDTAEDLSASSTASATTVTVIDATPSISVSILGSAQEGQTLSASITGYEGDDTLAYQWTSGTTVLGSGSTYQVSETDEGNKITLTVTDTAEDLS